jgi:hypothetical protein
MSRIFGAVRQNGYVVRNIQAAMDHWINVMGVGPWYYIETVKTDWFRHRGVDSPVAMSIALANSGDLQIELIQPRNDAPSLYKEFLDAGHDRPPTVSSSRLSPRTTGIPRAVITSTELLVILLANASKCGGDPVDTALAMGRTYGRTLGARTIEIIATPLSASDMTALNRIGRPLFGDTFSAAVLRASLPRTVMCQNDNRS